MQCIYQTCLKIYTINIKTRVSSFSGSLGLCEEVRRVCILEEKSEFSAGGAPCTEKLSTV